MVAPIIPAAIPIITSKLNPSSAGPVSDINGTSISNVSNSMPKIPIHGIKLEK